MDGTALATDATVSGAGVISLEHDAGNGGVVEILTFQVMVLKSHDCFC